MVAAAEEGMTAAAAVEAATTVGSLGTLLENGHLMLAEVCFRILCL